LPEDTTVAPHLSRFVEALDRAFRTYGEQDGLPSRLRDAVLSVPRHRFVHRYRLPDSPLQDFAEDPARHLDTIYADQPMIHVDEAGVPLPSTNSQPSYVLWLLHLLDLRPGQRVLEIGSGSGWLAAIAGHLVRPGGDVTGVEIIPALARQSAADLADLGIDGVAIVSGDGADGASPGGLFDRMMVTAGVWEPSPHLWSQVVEGGLILVPLELRGGGGCRVSLLRRTGERLLEERSTPGWFVPLVGRGQGRHGVNRPLETLASWSAIKDGVPPRWLLPLASQSGGAQSAAARFRGFLGRTEPGFAVFAPAEPPSPGRTDIDPFGLVDDADGSVALWRAGELLAHGGLTAARRLAHAYVAWTELGMPDGASFSLEVSTVDATTCDERERWVEVRGGTALTWRLHPGASDWRTLLHEPGADAGHGGQDTVRLRERSA